MARLNTKKLMRQCRAIAKTQEQSITNTKGEETLETSSCIQLQSNPIPDQDGDILRDSIYAEHTFKETLLAELENFNGFIKDASRRLYDAKEAEQYPNDAIQDILHVIELAPSWAEEKDISKLLHRCRELRRIAKDELEVAEIWANYVKANESVFKKLDTVIGDIRRVINKQPTRMYNFKTNIIGEQGTWLEKEEPQSDEQVYEQLSFLDDLT